MVGEIDVDKVADAVSLDQLVEWWAYGAMVGWFPSDETSNSGALSVEDSLAAMQGLNG